MAEPNHIFVKPLPNLAFDNDRAAFPFFYITPSEHEKIIRKYYPEEREALESWHVETLKVAKGASIQNSSNLGLSSEEARLLKRALEFNWHALLEDIGLWISAEVPHTDHDNKPANEPEEEEIIAGPPLRPQCNTELHADYGGAAVKWGLMHHKESVADCCQACLDQARNAKPGKLKCNIWVYCPSEFGCYSPDKYEHKHHECWLKQFAV
ncbi:uncharacterized protein LOC123442085 [Hordeum vulgare subsp. vulgare]|uniref:uncharacterized protein LOC123442085 n=1 Tax=Hordeum vulgare subsp. vulgare TaxID=112509 RepID=UPI001D1A35A7|nr:uncharacterized protein LOC123442085 [Hordeum vulgare subsp. vulgare]